MKNNIKALQLIESGLSSKTVSKLTEFQIDELHSKMVGEQITTLPSQPSYKVGDKGGTLPASDKGYAIKKNPLDNSITATKMGGEMEEGKKKTKKSEPNPWAICHSQVGPKKTRKFERCVQAVKKSLKEGKNPVSLFLENEIMRIVEKHIPPRISKGDLLQYLSEDTETAPAKPKTKPTTKPETKPRPKNPGHNPNPGEKEAPRAKKQMGEDTETAPSKPITKPTTRPRPISPGQNPNPGEKEAPRAISPERAKTEVINTIMKILENE
jgi:hypothetical protein